MWIYLAYKKDHCNPYSELQAINRFPLLLTHTVSLGLLINQDLILLPNHEWYQPTLGLDGVA